MLIPVTDNVEAVRKRVYSSRVISYIPYGEIFVEQQSGGWQSPYLFNSKELDSETGLYYYGARYLDPSEAMWISVDPLFEKYVGMTPYGYCAGNPIVLVDINGEGDEVAEALSFLPDKLLEQLKPHIEDVQKLIDNGLNPKYLAIGLEVSLDGSADISSILGVEGEVSGTCGLVVFLGGDDAGYPYKYVGGEAGGGVCVTSPEVAGSVGSSVSFFMAYNTTQTGDHSTFDGPYNYLRITGATSIDIPGLPVSVDRSYGLSSARGEDWTIWSLELSRSVSLGTPSPLPVSAVL